MKYVILIICLFGISFVFIQGLKKDPTIIPSNLISRKFPEFQVKPLKNYDVLSQKDLQKKEIKIVNFFASWCPPCKVEHPQLIELSKSFNLYGIAKKDKPQQLLTWLEELGNPFKKVGLDNEGMVSIEWGVYGLPETFIVDDSGVIIYKHIGPVMKKDVIEIKSLIKKLK
ncbi:MAG: DsbE family thiol:disulfide interchange protein [Rickettsiales bacterium]|nr:DsbE family thiol:disulfide interchange protein [Rickettsiales bacterium]